MAGKYHRDYQHYAVDQDGHVLAPGSKIITAYAEGYNAFRSGLPKANPHPFSEDDDSGFQSWEYGWQDGERGSPPTHVGGAQATPLLPFVANLDIEGLTLHLSLTGGEPDFTIDWGDGTNDVISDRNIDHVYASTGTYHVVASDALGSMSEGDAIFPVAEPEE